MILHERKNVKKLIEYFHTVFAFYKEQGITEIIYKPVPGYLSKTINELEHFVMNMLDAVVTKVDTAFTIDFRNELKFQERRRRSVKKGEKAGTEIRFDNDFAGYWNEYLSQTSVINLAQNRFIVSKKYNFFTADFRKT